MNLNTWKCFLISIIIIFYHKDYSSGRSIGRTITQDLINRDIIVRIYLSKDTVPLVSSEESQVIYGRFVDKDGNPLQGMSFKLKDTEYQQTSGTDGSFTFVNVAEGTVNFVIVDVESGKPIVAKVLYGDKVFASDKINLVISPSKKVYRVYFLGR